MADRPIYLDHQATTPLDPAALDAMLPYLTSEFGNTASPHAYGYRTATAVQNARRHIRDLIAATRDTEIVFTSGATEANHLALIGAATALRHRGNHVITTAIEHKSVLAACQRLEADGFTITHLGADPDGTINPDAVEAALTARTVLVSVMHGNNEIGTIQPLAEIAARLHQRGILLHTDAAQTLGAIPVHVDHLGVDLASFSAHKCYGPQGVGALYIRRTIPRPHPQLRGGGQEHGLRAGTSNVAGIVGFGEAARLLGERRDFDARHVRVLRDDLQRRLLDRLPHAHVNGSPDARLPGNLSLTLPGVEAASLLESLPDLALSTGSACNSGDPDPSHVLTAIGLTRDQARATLRISLGRNTTRADVDHAAARIIRTVRSNITETATTRVG